MNTTHFRTALILVVVSLLAACTPSAPPANPPAYPDPGSSVPPDISGPVNGYPLPGEPFSSTPLPYPVPTKDQSPPGSPIVKGDDPFPGWATYLNSAYDFAFRYPDAYLVEDSPHQARLTRPGVELLVSFRGVEDTLELPHDLPYTGELEPGAEIEFFEQGVLEVRHLVNGQVMAVEYAALNSAAPAGELPGPVGTAFAIQLFSTQSDVPLSEDLLAETRLLLSSFETWTNN